MAQCRGSAADLPVAAFTHHQLQEAAVGVLGQGAQLHGLARLTIEGHAASPALKGVPIGLTLHQDAVGLGVLKAGMGEPEGERAVVGEEQGTPAPGVEAADGMEAGASGQLWRQQIEHRRSPIGVMATADDAGGLVQEHGDRFRPGQQRPAIHLDLIATWQGTIAEAGDAAVAAHPALAQQRLGLAA